MRDKIVVKDLWLPVHFGDKRPDKIDTATWDVLHLKTTTYILCFIDISMYNNFNEQNKAHELWEKIDIVLENKNVLNRVSIFRKITRLRYQDDSSVVEHMNTFQWRINQTTSLEVPLGDEVLTLLLLGSLSDSWEMLVVMFWETTDQKGSTYP